MILQNQAEKIKQDLLELKRKGYSDVSQIPKGADISNLPSQPLPEGEPNNLLNFKETLSKITNLAREKRNALSLEFMAPFQGTMAASDFSSILGNLNRASDTFSSDITKDIFKGQETKYELRNVGDDLMEFELDAKGKVKGSRVVVSKPKSTDKLFSADDRKKLLGAGLNDDDIEKMKKDIIEHGADALIEGLPNERQKNALKEILSGEVKDKPEDIEKIINENNAMTDNEIKVKLQKDTKLSQSEINAYIANRIADDDLKFEAEELVTDLFSPKTFSTRGSEIKTAKEKAIEDIRSGGTISVEGKTIKLTEEVQKRLINFINSVSVETVDKLFNERKK